MPEYNICLSADFIALLGKWVGRGPYFEVAPLIAEIQRQVNEQNAGKPAPPPLAQEGE